MMPATKITQVANSDLGGSLIAKIHDECDAILFLSRRKFFFVAVCPRAGRVSCLMVLF